MSDELVQHFVWEEAGLHFGPDAIYYRDFGIQFELVESGEYDGVWTQYADSAEIPS